MIKTLKLSNKKERYLLQYRILKERFEKELHSETLRKYKILKKAYGLGKKIYGHFFSVAQLALDYEIPYTTTKRILALSKANNKTWNKINSGKITAFKAAMVLLKKDTHYQDEVIDMVIKENLSTYQIYSLNVRQKGDIEKERLRIALENGFARASWAARAFNLTIDRLEGYLSIDLKNLPVQRLPILKSRLNEVQPKIKNFIDKIDGKR